MVIAHEGRRQVERQCYCCERGLMSSKSRSPVMQRQRASKIALSHSWLARQCLAGSRESHLALNNGQASLIPPSQILNFWIF